MNIDEIYFARKDETVKLPTKREEDGCYDVYAHITGDFEIPPHTNKLIPTGLYSAFSPKYRIGIRERGSNTKANMITMAGQIDSGYRGEWFISIYNGNSKTIVLTDDTNYVDDRDEYFILVPTLKAIAQFAVELVPNVEVKEVSIEDIQKFSSERGTGALGSSNK